jgi:HSP20 family protein
MADPQQSTASETTAGVAREVRSGNRQTEAHVEAERRSFEGEAARGGSIAAGAARSVADAGRHLTEAGRQTRREVSETWRAPFDPFAAVQMDMSRLFDEMWRQTLGFSPLSMLHSARPFSGLAAAHLFGLPASDVRETDEAYVLSVELPGLKREDIEIQLRGDNLIVSGHKEDEKSHAAAPYRISERRFGRFERSFPVPTDVERGRIEASCHDGLLTVRLPKSERSRPPTRIEVKG